MARHWLIGLTALGVLTLLAAPAEADEASATVSLKTEEGLGPEVGTVRFEDGPHGLLVIPDLRGLPPGPHGTHVHENADCLAPGSHYDPMGAGRHEGPYGNGHLGDLPALIIDQNGGATIPVLAPRLSVSDVRGRSLVLHSGGDNYADAPEENGGGGPHLACGPIR